MKKSILYISIWASLASSLPAAAAERPHSRNTGQGKREIEDLLVGAGLKLNVQVSPNRSQDLETVFIHWQGDPGSARISAQRADRVVPPGVFTLSRRQHSVGTLPRQRLPQLSSEQILVVCIDGREQVRQWTLITDPRVLRSEVPGPTGELSGKVFYRPNAPFVVTLGDPTATAELRFYHPRWTGETFALDPIGRVSLR